MSIYDCLTEEQECAVIKGYLAGREKGVTEPPETYKGNTVLMVCWYWGYDRAKKRKTVH